MDSKTHVNLQEAVLGRAREAVWNDEEIFLSPLTLNCYGVTIHRGQYNSFCWSAI